MARRARQLEAFGEVLRRLRTERSPGGRTSFESLAQWLVDHGHPIERSNIKKYENGREPDVFVLAGMEKAFDIRPLGLVEALIANISDREMTADQLMDLACHGVVKSTGPSKEGDPHAEARALSTRNAALEHDNERLEAELDIYKALVVRIEDVAKDAEAHRRASGDRNHSSGRSRGD